jgi:hypothetical protein
MKTKIDDNQKAVAVAAKMTADELSDFMDRVAARLDLYDKRDEGLVTARPTKKEH